MSAGVAMTMPSSAAAGLSVVGNAQVQGGSSSRPPQRSTDPANAQAADGSRSHTATPLTRDAMHACERKDVHGLRQALAGLRQGGATPPPPLLNEQSPSSPRGVARQWQRQQQRMRC